ncbi:MAG: flagellar protein FlaG [Treponema sp.]|nr:flagellar protein FlaG [Treponema sp.]
MNTISTNSPVQMAMDGQTLYNSVNTQLKRFGTSQQNVAAVAPNGAEVAQNIANNIAEVKADSQQLQRMSEMVDGRKLQFNVNKELDCVVVRVVDSNTNQVVKEIPSEDMQKLKLRIRQAIGTLIDDLV